MSDRLIALGVVARPHGLRGEVRVHLFHADSTLLLEQREVHVGPEGPSRRVISARKAAKFVILQVEGCSGRDAAEALRGVEILVPREVFPEPDSDELYLADLETLEIRSETGERLGQVEAVMTYPSVDCLRVRTEQGYREVPVLEPWLLEVNVEEGYARVADFDSLPLEPLRVGKDPGEGG